MNTMNKKLSIAISLLLGCVMLTVGLSRIRQTVQKGLDKISGVTGKASNVTQGVHNIVSSTEQLIGTTESTIRNIQLHTAQLNRTLKNEESAQTPQQMFTGKINAIQHVININAQQARILDIFSHILASLGNNIITLFNKSRGEKIGRLAADLQTTAHNLINLSQRVRVSEMDQLIRSCLLEEAQITPIITQETNPELLDMEINETISTPEPDTGYSDTLLFDETQPTETEDTLMTTRPLPDGTPLVTEQRAIESDVMPEIMEEEQSMVISPTEDESITDELVTTEGTTEEPSEVISGTTETDVEETEIPTETSAPAESDLISEEAEIPETMVPAPPPTFDLYSPREEMSTIDEATDASEWEDDAGYQVPSEIDIHSADDIRTHIDADEPDDTDVSIDGNSTYNRGQVGTRINNQPYFSTDNQTSMNQRENMHQNNDTVQYDASTDLGPRRQKRPSTGVRYNPSKNNGFDYTNNRPGANDFYNPNNNPDNQDQNYYNRANRYNAEQGYKPRDENDV